MNEVAYNAGWDAFKAGTPRSAGEYITDDSVRVAWLHGWGMASAAAAYVKGLFA